MELVGTKPQGSAVKLALCIPSNGEWKADFGMSLAQMVAFIAGNVFEQGCDRQVIVLDKRTSLLPRSRQECLEDAILQDCTHALFLDVDQSFPRNTAHILIAAKKPVVACNIAVKTVPSYPTARMKSATPFGLPLSSHGNHKVGLEKVWRVGCGIMLVDLSIMPAIAKPWFEVRYHEKCAQYVGEDWYFCERVEAAGHDIYIEHELSRQIGHVGNKNYTIADIPVLDELQAAA